MPEPTFRKTAIEHHEESIGVDMRPPIDLKLDRQRVQQFYNLVSEKHGSIFESLEQRPQGFRITKPFTIPGKATLTVQTFVLHPRGPVFAFPRYVMGHDSFPWPTSVNGVVLDCLKILRSQFPTHRFHRIGKVRRLVYGTGEMESPRVVREQFCSGIPAGSSSVTVGWNQASDQYNIKLSIESVEERNVQVGPAGGSVAQRTGQFGVQVVLDVNNRKMDRPLEAEEMKIILERADQVYDEELLAILNGKGS